MAQTGMLCQCLSEQAERSAFMRSIGGCLEVFISARKKVRKCSFEED